MTLLTGKSSSIREVYRLIERISGTDSAVVVLGETGTGKELIARLIHERSLRASKPFIAVNCGALPEGLIESELFGHLRGSFTGANADRAGLFEVAAGGTLFLDEIGELSKAVQAKLLRFLENGEIRRVGDNVSIHCNVRVVCATLRNLELMVNSGEFREDLWFRINTFVIKVPSLRERREDLPALIRDLVVRFKPELGEVLVSRVSGRVGDWGEDDVSDILTDEAFKCLLEYDWPGNIRQLANALEHALVLSDGLPIGVDSLPEFLAVRGAGKISGSLVGGGVGGVSNNILLSERDAEARPTVCKNALDSTASMQVVNLTKQQDSLSRLAANLTAFDPSIDGSKLSDKGSPQSLKELEAKAIVEALQRNEGNKAKAAEELGISLKTLYNKLVTLDKRD
ncbi:MAG: sigma-54 dependent transcriptional regulator [Planctomycetaceae bacterium]|jgi:two-component system NtrC family response regulator|nr:sigma-54 dependent transcriptional regulator [Planctomycetaceae bacterium]